MFDDIDEETKTIFLVGALLYLGTRVTNAVKTISREVQRFNNHGLTTEEDEEARKTLTDRKASNADKLKAVATLRTKVVQAKAAGYGVQVATLEMALDALEKELHGQDELEIKRKEWKKRQEAAAAAQRAGS